MSSGDFKNFLKETKYCDFSHSNIQELAHEIADKYDNHKDKAIVLFYWVRDNILYRVGLWNRKASETLNEREGTCTNKTNLLVALLRVLGITAGYGIMEVKGQEYFGPIILPMFKRRVGKRSLHIYCYIKVNDTWMRVDPSPDKELSNNTSYFNPTTKLVEWNGESDALENLDQSHILKDSGPISDIDYIISKRPRNAIGIPIKVANLYIRFIRHNIQKIYSISELESLFKSWLRKNYLLYYYFYFLVSWYRDFKLKLGK